MTEATEPTKPRRWYLPRFGLRTLFVVVTLFSLWLGWQVNIVQERKAWLKRIEIEGGRWIVQGGLVNLDEHSTSHSEYLRQLLRVKGFDIGNGEALASFRIPKMTIPITYEISWFRTFLGDQPIGLIDLPPDSPYSIDTLKAVFPEARSVD